MRSNFACSPTLITLLVVLLVSPLTFAQSVVIDYTGRGWYNDSGQQAGANYIVGDTANGLCCDHRNYFVFDLAGVTQPIASAILAVHVPGGQFAPGYSSPDPSENYELHDVSTPADTLVAGLGGVAAWNDLGAGVVYGTRTMTAADDGSVVEITLNSSAIAAMNATHGLFGIGGSITTLDDLVNDEYTFGWTDTIDISQLRLTVVPEPSTLLLLGIGAISLLGCRKAIKEATETDRQSDAPPA